METLLNLFSNYSKKSFIATLIILIAHIAVSSAFPASSKKLEENALKGWNICWEGKESLSGFEDANGSMMTLACRPDVNVSLNEQGFAKLTELELVINPNPMFQYDIDIMGPLNDTVFCEQLGQDLMVVVTELPSGNSCMSSVFVEDKLDPVLVCTADILPCNVYIPGINFQSLIESVTDNCDPDPDLWYSWTIQNLPCNADGYTQIIHVIWTATDESGNSSTCDDVIYLKKPALGQIVFPANVTVSCLAPNIDPSVTGEPTFNGLPVGLTCQITVSHTDQVIPMCNGSQKIIRLWTVMDWCNSGTVTHPQEIRIVDNMPPNLTCPSNLTINSDPGKCTAKYTLPFPNVSDACSNINMIDIDIYVAGVLGIFSPGNMVTLGLGTTLITIRATDPCGNSATCHYNVTVRDDTPPIIICPSNVTIDCEASTLPANTGTATAIDFCDASPTVTYTDVTVSFSNCALGYKINRTWKAMDDSGNTSCCTQMIVQTDNTPPIITCPPSVTIACTESTAPSHTGNATATDHCDDTPTITFNDVTIGGTCPQERTINRTWRATDDCSNSSTCVQVISVEDNIAPLITCPPNVTIQCTSNTLPANTGTATATDNCDGTPNITFSDVNIPTGPQEYTINRTWTATDDCGNSSTCLQLILVHDDIPPVITCPNNITIQCTDSTLPANTGTATATDNCDPFPDITFSDVTVGGLCPQERTITRTWVATDDCGNASTCTQTIFVDDSMAPLITCPANVAIQCTASTLPVNTGTATATDNCDGTPSITFSDVTVGGICPQEMTITRTWRATDDCGNSSTCNQTILVDDSMAPFITCPANVTIQCTDSTLPANTGSATASDNCDFSPTITFSDVTIAGACIQERKINRTWVATDDCGNSSTCLQMISVDDSTAPLITCPPNVTINCTASTLPGNTGTATATDNCTGTPTITFSDVTIGGSCPQGFNITRTWTAADGCGNNSTCTQSIVVFDNTAPVITCPSNVTIQCTASTLPGNTGTATASDACDNSPIITFTDVTVAGGGCPQEYSITRTWRATDHCGNSSTCTQSIVVDDSVAPAITCPPNVTIQCSSSTLPGTTGTATATDNCDAVPFITFSDITAGTGCPQGLTITRTWNAADDCGNSSTCIQIITVADNVAPAITCPVNVTISCSASTLPANTGSATATDVCDTSPTITFSNVTIAGGCPQEYTIIRTWIATDDCGNSGTCNQTIVLDDTTPPICMAHNITVSLGGDGTVTITASQVDAGSSDACGPVTLSVNPSTFDCDDIGDNPVVLTVTDCAGNTSTCNAIVTVEDSGGLQAECQNVTIVLDANGMAHVDPEQVDDGSGGGCAPGNLEFTLTQEDFDCTDLGFNLVTLTVTDQLGNTATCTAFIIVVDNSPPTITCPANLTVSCETVTDPDNTAQFGSATGSDNCQVVITETHVINLNNCNVGTITRTFTATDNAGNTATCTQVVTVNNPNPLDLSDITWPNSPVNVNICNSTDPEDIPNGVPVISPSALLCSDPVISHTDQIQMIVDNNPNTPCQIITRTWTIVDNCQQNGTFTFVQTINVQDMVPPLFTNINDMTKVANSNCVAFFTLIASATDCAGVSITNNSPYGVNSGSNASGNYPVGVTVVLFTATDGCGNISTMDVVITVTDPNPIEFQCEKMIVYLPEETEITLNAKIFVTFLEGSCTDSTDYVVSYSGTDPFDSLMVFDCGDVGVTTFPLWFYTIDGVLVDSCATADLELRDPTDFCQDGLALIGNVEGEEGQGVDGVEVSISNAPMVPDTTDLKGRYMILGLNKGTGYMVTPFDDENHREGVSTLDLVMIQKHLLGITKLKTPYKMIAADANKSGKITALDLLEIRKLILGIYAKFPNNTSWRFVDQRYIFPDPYDPFAYPFNEQVWLDSVSQEVNIINFVGVKIGDVNGSYFLTHASGDKIESRNSNDYKLGLIFHPASSNAGHTIEISALPGQGEIYGAQFSLFIGDLAPELINEIHSDILASNEWYYDYNSGTINVSWSPKESADISGLNLLTIPGIKLAENEIELGLNFLSPEAYKYEEDDINIRNIRMRLLDSQETETGEYHLYQNIPNPFSDGTVISFSLPQKEKAKLIIYDNVGRKVFEHESMMDSGYNEVSVSASSLKVPGIYYYTLYTANASFTRKMSYTND